jgi:hypothetical protein
MRDNDEVRELLEKEWISEFQKDRDEIREHAKKNIAKIQEKIGADSTESGKRR